MNFTKKQKGVLLMVLSAFLFAAMQITVRLSGSRIGLMQQVFFRNSVSLVISFLLIRKNDLSLFGERKYQPMLFGRSFSGFMGIIFLFYASNHANQADITILSKMSPFLITLFAFLFLKEKIPKVQVPALLIAFGGAFLVANPTFHSNLLPLGSAFVSALVSSVAYTLLGYLKDKVDALTIIMHFSTFCAVVSAPFMMAAFVTPSPYEFVLLLLIGLFGSLGQIALTYSYRMAPASEVSVYNYSGILFSMLLGYFVLNESVAPTSIIGGILVIAASALVYLYS